jgi:hypothetical protein
MGRLSFFYSYYHPPYLRVLLRHRQDHTRPKASIFVHTVRPHLEFQKNMIALRKRIENLERTHKWNYTAIAADLGITIEEVKACHPSAHPQNHDWVAIAAQFGIDLGKQNG